jgi:hypothetical protein
MWVSTTSNVYLAEKCSIIVNAQYQRDIYPNENIKDTMKNKNFILFPYGCYSTMDWMAQSTSIFLTDLETGV